jgi:hypothetical protein
LANPDRGAVEGGSFARLRSFRLAFRELENGINALTALPFVSVDMLRIQRGIWIDQLKPLITRIPPA